ncbi:hypothetical protein C8R44DRAFT_755421 [Mycena epipterygia]|nr:hypothetical protein C8R44DRAFT_755421 [Mycena epipterygia]
MCGARGESFVRFEPVMPSSHPARPPTAIERFLLPATSLMADTSLNDYPSWIPSPAPILSTFELDALTRRTSLIQTTVKKCLKDWPPWDHIRTTTTARKEVLMELMKNRKLWIFFEGDQDYCLMDNPTMDAEKKWTLSRQDVDMLAAQTTPAIRIAMIIWLVITSSAVQDFLSYESTWDKWDLQGRAITIWADTYSEIMRSKKRPSETIPTDDDAVAAFKSLWRLLGISTITRRPQMLAHG